MPATRFVIRVYHRVPVRCDLYYMGQEFLGKGMVVNVSRNGFRALGDCYVVPGLELIARLSLPQGGGSVDIQCAVVRWVRGLWFGAKILKLNPKAEERIGTFLRERLRECHHLPCAVRR
ncbi:MAG: PilZ domain-containing protein [Nitrospira sp.]|nr:PilZ domain-containing protein [Nitrospira sp.]